MKCFQRFECKNFNHSVTLILKWMMTTDLQGSLKDSYIPGRRMTMERPQNSRLKLVAFNCLFVCVEVLWHSQPNGVMSSAVSLPNHMFTGQA